MDIKLQVEDIQQMLAALNRMANEHGYSNKVISPPLRKAMQTLREAIQRGAPRQDPERAKRMRRYPRFANFPFLRDRIGLRYLAATRKREATGKVGVNVTFKENIQAPHGTWVGIGTQERWIKRVSASDRIPKANSSGKMIPGYRGQIIGTHWFVRAVAPITASVVTQMETDIKARFQAEALHLTGTPFRSF